MFRRNLKPSEPIYYAYDPRGRVQLFKGTEEQFFKYIAINPIPKVDRSHPLFEVIEGRGNRRFIRIADVEALKKHYLTYGKKMSPPAKYPLSITQITGDELDFVMRTIYAEWRYNWCGDSGPCRCAGCVDRNLGIDLLGFTFDEWKQWVDKNPPPQSPSKIPVCEVF
ncbi:hypothetical protein RYA05_02020 [Pseudomonas syringae pv. actinidiae]|nr:hypothetical protein [Pseudomonas syringae pv. actinidiae]